MQHHQHLALIKHMAKMLGWTDERLAHECKLIRELYPDRQRQPAKPRRASPAMKAAPLLIPGRGYTSSMAVYEAQFNKLNNLKG